MTEATGEIPVGISISLDQELVEQLDELAQEFELTRSGVLALAVEQFILQREDRRLLTRLDRAYGAEVSGGVSGETRRRGHRRVVEGEW